MKIVLRIIMGFIILVGMSACTNVYSPKPVGETPVVLNPEEWDGNWMNADGFLSLKVKYAKAGKFEVAWIEDQNMESFTVQLRSFDDWVFGSTVDNAKVLRYVWGRVKKDSRSIVIWIPDTDKFKPLIEKSILPGKIDSDGNISLGELTTEHMKIITSEKYGVLFDWDDPIVMFKAH